MKKKSTSTTPREWVCFDKELANIMPTSEVNNNHTQCNLFVFVFVSLHTVFQTNWRSAIMIMTVPIYNSILYHNPENNSLNNHRHNLGRIMGVTNFSLRTSHVRNKGKSGSYQSLIYTHPFPHSEPNFFFYLPLLKSTAKKNYSWAEKILYPYPSYVTPPSVLT